MSYGINGHDLPFIRNYEQAKRKYDSLKPIRGRNNVRPLGDRRKQHQRIEEARPNFSGAPGIACVLYHTQCVTYYEDGTIHLKHGGYISQSTCKFIERIAPITSCRVDNQRGCLVVRVASGDYKCGNDGLWLRYNETGGYVLIDPVPFEVTSVDRKAMREVRKQYAPFMQYAMGLGKLMQWEKPDPRPHPWVTTDYHLLDLMRGDDLEQWAMAYALLTIKAGQTYFSYNYTTKTYENLWVCTEARVSREFTHMLKMHHANEVLVREVLPLGVHKKDPNGKYARLIRGVRDER